MRSPILQNILDNTPKDVSIFIDKYTDLVIRINQLLKDKGYNQKTLSEKLGKKPSEIHKWLSGNHNFTLRSIAKLEAELGETLLEVPMKRPTSDSYSHFEKTTYRISVYKNTGKIERKKEDWQQLPRKKFSNVG